ncbi:MAG: histidine phosphatase family protein [Promethearchaeota archaeon]|jgi:broad specificity phosphatase PhoE
MPNNILIFLRHAETKIDNRVKNSEWKLTEKGEMEALEIAKSNFFTDTDILISSNEEKAYRTIYPLAEICKKKILREAELNEINRDHGKFLEAKEYISTMKLCMLHKDKSYNNWETANKALERFSKKIEDIDYKYDNKKILIASHGTVINLYFAKILGKLENIFERAQTNTFCDYGIIQNRKVIKDITKSDS